MLDLNRDLTELKHPENAQDFSAEESVARAAGSPLGIAERCQRAATARWIGRTRRQTGGPHRQQIGYKFTQG